MEKVDLIQGEKFYSVADFLYSPDVKPQYDDYNPIKHTFDISKPGNIIYTHTLYVRHLFEHIKDIDREFTVVTHNSDINIDESFEIPSNVKRWFSQNVNLVDDRVESIPIGIQNNRWKPDLNKILNSRCNPKKMLYINHKTKTNPERAPLYDLLKWATLKMRVSFSEYIDDICNHRFVLCPPGNGLDTHRTWECLYLGAIPIEKRNLNNRFYTDLPICFVDDWSEVTLDFLEKEYKKIKSRKWNLDKLKIGYWKNKISCIE